MAESIWQDLIYEHEKKTLVNDRNANLHKALSNTRSLDKRFQSIQP